VPRLPIAARPRGLAVLIALLLIPPSVRAAQDGPEVFSHTETGEAVVRATHLTEPLRIDGRLDDDIYRRVPPITAFVQTLPVPGAPSTERTEAWVLYDDQQIYVSCRCWDSAPPAQWVANDMRRDSQQLRDNDNFGVSLDTYHDRRNAFTFYTTPLGAIADQTFTDEGNPNRDWNQIWDVRTGRFDGGWTVEIAIPFKSLRYTPGHAQTWGIQLRRGIRRKNEWTHLTVLPPSAGGSQAWFRVSGAATLVGLDLPPAGKNLEIKPYGIARTTTDRLAAPPVSNDGAGDFGVDLKYGITPNLTADLTYNTDFAQVEVDEQQVNLTRFALSFPEKRDFFLEGRGIFDFGRGTATGGGGGGGGGGGVAPTLFYSRRIGLNRGRVVPIDVGGRITGKVGKFNVGFLDIRTDDEHLSATPATNFAVVRVKRDILRRSSIGAILTNRSQSVDGGGGNQAYGADAAFGFFENLTMGGYIAQTQTPGLDRDDVSYQGRFEYAGDRYGARADYLKVGDNFNPEVGLVRRDDFARSFGSLRFSPRPQSIDWVRQFRWEAEFEYLQNGVGQLETRTLTGRFNTELEISDEVTFEVNRNHELLVRPFEVARDVFIPTGSYDFRDVQLEYLFGPQRRASGTLSFQHGTFYDGTITAVGFGTARVSVTDQLSVEPSLSINRIELPNAAFTTRVLRARTDYAFSPRMFTGGLIQYASNDRVFSTNLRFRWEYRPGSELFVVYTDERDTHAPGFPALKNRAVVVKVNRLVRF
jgi:hypothetical protein